MNIHQLLPPSFSIADGNFLFANFNREMIVKYYPKLSQNLSSLLDALEDKIDRSNFKLCHGDFNPNNLLFIENI